MKSTWNEILSHHKKNSVYITFRNGMNFVSGVVREKRPIQLKPIIFVLIKQVHVQVFPFIWFHIRQCLHVLSPKMKFLFCQNDGDEMAPAMSFISVYFMYTVMRDWPDTKSKKFNFAQNEISYKHPFLNVFVRLTL